MTAFLTVRAFGGLDLDHAASIASLPASLRLADGGAADIAVVSSDAVSVAAGIAAAPRALVVTRPTELGADAMAALNAAGVPVFPALVLAPRLRLVDARAHIAKAGLVRSRLGWQGGLRETLLEHLAGLEAVLGALADVSLLDSGDAGHLGTARSQGGITVSWSGLHGAARGEYELDIIGLADRLEVSGELDGSARPLLVRHGSAGGLQQPHGVFETGLRCFWRGVIAELAEGSPKSQWPDFARLHALAEQLAASVPQRRGDAA